MPYSYSHSNMVIWISFKPFDSEHRVFWEHFYFFHILILPNLAGQKPEGFH